MIDHASAEPARAAPWFAMIWRLGRSALFGMLIVLLLSQIPTNHQVNLGAADAAYIQGFGAAVPHADGMARWTDSNAVLLFPQAGLPGRLTLRLRGHPELPPTDVSLRLNGTTELARFAVADAWVEREVVIQGGVLKASDFFVQIVSELRPLPNGQLGGVLVDQAHYRTLPPTLPYPTQLIYAALAGILLSLLGWRMRTVALALVLGGIVWLLLYRLALPIYPYPFRQLPLIGLLAISAAVLVRHGPQIAVRAPALVGWVAPFGVIGGWTAATLLAAQQHVTLSRPGVENDFRVFATRETLGQIFQADGFYNLGYPLLLWLVRPFAQDNPFLAARLLAALTGAIFLLATYLLARRMLAPSAALLVLMIAALSGFVAQYGLYIGSDMPFAASLALSVALLAWGVGRQGTGELADGGDHATRRTYLLLLLAGLCGGVAFLMRHPGLLVLPWGSGLILLTMSQRRWAHLLAFGLGFLLAAAPQLVVNTLQTGQPLYSQQAKNIWLAVYGGTDWGRWDEAPNTISLAEVVLSDPPRFLANWWHNLVAFSGSGAEDTSEFGRAVQLRMVNWPANWLALFGLAAWAWLSWRERHTAHAPLRASLLLLIGLYVAAISTAFLLQRFVLPLTPIYALAAGWLVWRFSGGGRRLLAFSLALIVVLWGGFGAGQRYVLANQPPDEVAAVQMVQQTLPADARIAARVADRLPLAKYSAIAHQMVDWPQGSDLSRPISSDDLDQARANGAQYLLWDTASGQPPLENPPGALLAISGRYALYQL
jgi:4-amino-4-deoxy-L-arabinose transferase-like glycosyltransferase